VRSVWLTESAVGGGGVVEKFQARFAENPQRFFDLMTRALEPSDFERTDEQLTRFVADLADAANGSGLRTAVAAVRAGRETTHSQLQAAFDTLLAELRRRNYLITHPVVAALNARILRAGSGPTLDARLHSLLAQWAQTEIELGIEIDTRTFAWLCCGDATLNEVFGRNAGATSPRAWRFGILYSLFWPRGGAVRGHRLSTYNRFAELLPPEREFVRCALRETLPSVSITAAGWETEADRRLLDDGAVVLTGSPESLRAGVLEFAARPIDTGLLLTFAAIREVRSDRGVASVVVEIPEVTR
jgi:hypothetical protein